MRFILQTILWAPRLTCLGLLLSLSCTFGVDPSKGHFSCKGDADCGSGFACKPQLSGGNLCFPAADCDKAEACNGKDDDCNGAVDETFPENDTSCTTPQPGACAVGKQRCVSGALQCAAVGQPTAEVCDGIDNDCDGETDETFDLAEDDAHCGSCDKVCPSGSGCHASVCREESCADGTDNDQDLAIDCQDPDCLGSACDPADASVNCGAPGLIPNDGGPPDSGPGDGGVTDAGPLDAGAADAGQVDAGPPLRVCLPRESDCANGADDDSDGRVDCADPDCDAKTCFSGTQCTAGVCPGPG